MEEKLETTEARPLLSSREPALSKILQEAQQSPETRKPLLQKLQDHFGKAVVAFQTSFVFPVMIQDDDANMLEEVLLNTDTSKGLLLVLNSGGGSGLAAERIIKVCRSYSKTGGFEVLIPNMAKSAATMICFGAEKIWMSNTSELGPIDPQILIKKDDSFMRLSVDNVIKSYDRLIKSANETTGKIEPFLQQLQRYDAREIEQMRQEMQLATDIAVRSLKTGMMSSENDEVITERISRFTKTEESLTHGRPIYWKEVKESIPSVEHIDNESAIWYDIWELQLRYKQVLGSQCGKLVESVKDQYLVNPPR